MVDPGLRLSVKDILKHKWFNKDGVTVTQARQVIGPGPKLYLMCIHTASELLPLASSMKYSKEDYYRTIRKITFDSSHIIIK